MSAHKSCRTLRRALRRAALFWLHSTLSDTRTGQQKNTSCQKPHFGAGTVHWSSAPHDYDAAMALHCYTLRVFLEEETGSWLNARSTTHTMSLVYRSRRIERRISGLSLDNTADHGDPPPCKPPEAVSSGSEGTGRREPDLLEQTA